jgi:hypothetical protein
MISSALLAIFVFGLMGIVTYGLSHVVPLIFDSLPNVLILKKRIEAKMKVEYEFLQKIEMAKQQRKSIDDNLNLVERDHRVVINRQSMFPPDKPLPLVELGNAVQTNKMFEIFVHNTAVRRARRTEAVPLFNPFWEEPRYVLVWASDLSEARNIVNTAYPQEKEWHVEFRGEVSP